MILTPTEHDFPHRLGDKRLGFNTADIAQYIFAGEVPPDKMYELLTTRWGMGHNLAVTLIDHYGGHIYDIYRRLEQLNEKGEDFVTVSQAQTDDVQKCLDFDGDKKRMRELLTQIAEKGFAPLSKKQDPEAEVISQYNVGGLVQRDQATVIGLLNHVWGENTIGLVASKHSIRLIIARVLHINPELIAYSANADSTGVVLESKEFRAHDEQSIERLLELAIEIKEAESEFKAFYDPINRNHYMRIKEQTKEEMINLLRGQDSLIRQM